MKTQHFGIEIEMTGMTRKEVAAVLAEYFSGQVKYKGGAYDEYQVLDLVGRTWNIVSDASILARKRVDGRLVSAEKVYNVELVSPILHYEDIEPLQELIRNLRKAGAVSNSEPLP